ncbi:MAG: hypothetical protein H7Y37_15015 [Anaerolineae bacterium]|nr:hypothetical protein [Gloeobacterales cyanobacterium ES-bin-313]
MGKKRPTEVPMLSPITTESYISSSATVQEHPACELFPASYATGRVFAFGVGLGFVSLFLDGMGSAPLGWAGLALSALVLLYAGGRVVRN